MVPRHPPRTRTTIDRPRTGGPWAATESPTPIGRPPDRSPLGTGAPNARGQVRKEGGPFPPNYVARPDELGSRPGRPTPRQGGPRKRARAGDPGQSGAPRNGTPALPSQRRRGLSHRGEPQERRSSELPRECPRPPGRGVLVRPDDPRDHQHGKSSRRAVDHRAETTSAPPFVRTGRTTPPPDPVRGRWSSTLRASRIPEDRRRACPSWCLRLSRSGSFQDDPPPSPLGSRPGPLARISVG
jgi:hypothetical protein